MTKHRPAHEVELYRDGAVYTVIVSLPDVEAADLDLRWHDGALHVTVEADHVMSDPSGVFHRRVGVPREIDADGIEATLDEGVLEVKLPIAGEVGEHGHRIAIE